MSERQRAVARILALQGKLAKVATARLTQAQARVAEARAASQALQEFVNSAELTGALAVLAIARARSLAAAEAEAETRRGSLASARQAAETRLKLAERVGMTIAAADAADAERKALERLIEESVGRGTPADLKTGTGNVD